MHKSWDILTCFIFLFYYWSWHTIFYSFQVCNLPIWQFCTLLSSHHAKYSPHLSPYNIITTLLTIFPMMYFSSLWLIYFITGSLWLLIPFNYFAYSPTPFSFGNHQFVLCIYKSVSDFVCSLFFRFHI